MPKSTRKARTWTLPQKIAQIYPRLIQSRAVESSKRLSEIHSDFLNLFVKFRTLLKSYSSKILVLYIFSLYPMLQRDLARAQATSRVDINFNIFGGSLRDAPLNNC